MFGWLKVFFAGLGTVGVVLFFALLFCINGIALHYDITFWGSYVQHHAVHPSWILCILLGLISGPLPVTIAIITWILSFMI